MTSGSRVLAPGLLVFCLVATLAGCSSSGGAGAVFQAPATAGFSPSGSPATQNQVRLVGRSTGEDEVTVDVVVAGPTDSDDVFGFYFGLEVEDPGVASFVTGSQEIGPALDTTPPECSEPILFLNPSPSQPGLLTVSLTKLAPCGGNVIPAGEQTIISLTYRVAPEASTTVRLSGQWPTGRPWATDSARETIDSMTFDAASARFSGR